MITNNKTTARCPYCGYNNEVDASRLPDSYINVIGCDSDDGPGCGRMFAIQARMRLEVVSVYELVEHYNSVPDNNK